MTEIGRNKSGVTKCTEEPLTQPQAVDLLNAMVGAGKLSYQAQMAGDTRSHTHYGQQALNFAIRVRKSPANQQSAVRARLALMATRYPSGEEVDPLGTHLAEIILTQADTIIAQENGDGDKIQTGAFPFIQTGYPTNPQDIVGQYPTTFTIFK